ncbi:pyruvate kinase [Pelagibaculum spongiae]|uniref:Pyruvate kinase n=1 Tax=Pelagibaculum spongiae TaxID=2080658 RepID=A0A2V1GUP1_9GAMM|nr:pyruvate kinase [Pelagibaculum spongiae]PVZ69729.1 pyruvate kinase [Pelagibaculum spongiae]
MKRRTKIVATLGPATEKPEALEQLIKAGVNVVRMNFSHGEPEEHIERARLVREISAKLGRSVAILGDLQGPKIRIGRFRTGAILLEKGDKFALDAEMPVDEGDQHQIGLTYKTLPNDCKAGDMLLLDDGRVTLKVLSTNATRIETEVVNGGTLSNNKGINLQGGGLSAPALTEKDRRDIITASKIDVDYLAVSFPRCGADMDLARQLINEAGCSAAVLSKIERAEVTNCEALLREVILASDAVMVARGDLGVEIGDAELIGVQKKMIAMCRKLNRPVITATQMMESMIHNALPTRAEVFDVANAVLDGTDAVMLSAETATGDHPSEVIKAMANICLGAEKHTQEQGIPASEMSEVSMRKSDEAIAIAATYAANHLDSAKAIVAITESGTTPLWMSRLSSRLPILAVTWKLSTMRRMAMYRGVEPFFFDAAEVSSDQVVREALESLVKEGQLNRGDEVIVTCGDMIGKGSTSVMKIVRV